MAAYVLRAWATSRGRRRLGLLVVAVADRLGAAGPALRGRPLVGAGAAAGVLGGRGRGWPTPWPRGATSARACCPTGRARAGAGAGWAPRWRSPGGCSAGCSPAGRSAFVLLGAIFGSIATKIGGLLDSEQVRELFRRLGGTEVLTDAFLATEIRLHRAVRRGLRGLGGAASARRGAVWSHRGAARRRRVATALAGQPRGCRGRRHHSAVLSWRALGRAVVRAVQRVAGRRFGVVLAGIAVYLPAIWVMTALVVWLFRLAAPAGGHSAGGPWSRPCWWASSGLLLDLPEWVMDLSPFAHIPRIPGEDWTLGRLARRCSPWRSRWPAGAPPASGDVTSTRPSGTAPPASGPAARRRRARTPAPGRRARGRRRAGPAARPPGR